MQLENLREGRLGGGGAGGWDSCCGVGGDLAGYVMGESAQDR